MVLTYSETLELGTQAPDFSLLDTTTWETKTFWELRWKHGTVILFICNHCPFVVHVNDLIIQLAKEYQDQGIQFIAISSNDAHEYPEDGPERMTDVAMNLWYNFPYLYDESQEIARAYNAVCTPDIFFFGSGWELVYHGQLDDSRPGNGVELSWKDLIQALDSYLNSWEVVTGQKASVGCGIKWKK